MNKLDSLYRAKLRTFRVVKVAESTTPLDAPITTAQQAVNYLLPFYRDQDECRESVTALFLNGRHHPLAGKVLFLGSGTEAPVYPREIVRMSLLLGAAAVILSHSHLSQDLKASAEDIHLTRRVEEALKLLDIKLLDHIVVNVQSGQFKSMRESGTAW